MANRKPDSFLARVRKQQGRRAENAAALWLRMKGYRILARRLGASEIAIDLVASRQNTLAFVRVSGNVAQAEALAALDADVRRHIHDATRLFLAARPKLQNFLWRFDLVLLSPGRVPRHVRDAWRIEGAGS